MSTKKVHAENSKNYVVDAESEGFDYTLDYSSRNPNNEGVGTTPTGLLLTSLAGCHLMTARSFFNRHEIDAETLETDITGDFNHHDDGWELEADVLLTTDAQLDSEQIDDLKQFIDRYCTVSGVLSQGHTINLSVKTID